MAQPQPKREEEGKGKVYESERLSFAFSAQEAKMIQKPGETVSLVLPTSKMPEKEENQKGQKKPTYLKGLQRGFLNQAK